MFGHFIVICEGNIDDQVSVIGILIEMSLDLRVHFNILCEYACASCIEYAKFNLTSRAKSLLTLHVEFQILFHNLKR